MAPRKLPVHSKGRHRSKEEWPGTHRPLIERISSGRGAELDPPVTRRRKARLEGEEVERRSEEARPAAGKRSAKHAAVEYEPHAV